MAEQLKFALENVPFVPFTSLLRLLSHLLPYFVFPPSPILGVSCFAWAPHAAVLTHLLRQQLGALLFLQLCVHLPRPLGVLPAAPGLASQQLLQLLRLPRRPSFQLCASPQPRRSHWRGGTPYRRLWLLCWTLQPFHLSPRLLQRRGPPYRRVLFLIPGQV